MCSRWVLAGAALLVQLGASRTVFAYTVANAISVGCHEGITAQALRNVRAQLATAAPLPATSDEQALIADVQFTPDPDMKDLGGISLLLGVRDNDLKGQGADDLSALAEVHGNPSNQEEHCLRAPDQDEPGGTAAAVSSCRAFILSRVSEAIAGLDASGMPDINNRTGLLVTLSLRGQVTAPLPTYYIRMGQAIHAVEDSFTHTYRTPDEMQITVTLNWIDQVDGTLVESRDGPGHALALDNCADLDPIRTKRHQLAAAAATALLQTTLDPTQTTAQKMTAVNAVLDQYLSYSPGCTYGNAWCNAVEVDYANPSGCACSAGGGGGGLAAGLGALALLLVLLARRARRTSIIALTGCLLLLASPPAHAQAETTTTVVPAPTPGAPPTVERKVVTPETTTTTVTAPTTPDPNGPPPPTLVPVKEPGPASKNSLAFGGYLGASASIDKASIAGTLGARLRVSKHWTFGIDGEWNPWLAYTGTTIRSGVFNLYGTAMLRFPLAYENFNLRISASAGTSYLLMNLYGAPSGTTGIYIGGTPLALEWKLSRRFYLIIAPINISLPVPQLHGVPLIYQEYRTTLGFEIYAG
jgi:MYXO-CTERM domain-containing protein